VPDPDHYHHVMVVASSGFRSQTESFLASHGQHPNSALRFAGSRQIRVGKSLLDLDVTLPRAAQNSP
jgi:hypothetical protein